MPSILTEEEKKIVKTAIPKQTNKISAVGLVRLYIAHPDPEEWTYTGLKGAVALLYDKEAPYAIWLRLVDISESSLGVIWEQEVPKDWDYVEARTFFHAFETEECVYGFSFADEKEAKLFIRKMRECELNAPSATKKAPYIVGKDTKGVAVPVAVAKTPPTAPENRALFSQLLARWQRSTKKADP